MFQEDSFCSPSDGVNVGERHGIWKFFFTGFESWWNRLKTFVATKPSNWYLQQRWSCSAHQPWPWQRRTQKSSAWRGVEVDTHQTTCSITTYYSLQCADRGGGAIYLWLLIYVIYIYIYISIFQLPNFINLLGFQMGSNYVEYQIDPAEGQTKLQLKMGLQQHHLCCKQRWKTWASVIFFGHSWN